MLGTSGHEMQDFEREMKRLRARVYELEALEHRVEFLEAMSRQLREQADALSGSFAGRMLAGVHHLRSRLARQLRGAPAPGDITPERYRLWMADCERREVRVPERGPWFGVMAPDGCTLASLKAQTYPHWRPGGDGDYLLRPGPGAEFGPDALALLAEAAEEGAELIYCDEDVLDARGLRSDPWFKPDWSPDLLAATNYIGQAFAVSRELAGDTPEELCGRAASIVHVPRVLYHRREPARGPARRVRYPVPAGSSVEIVVSSREPEMLARCLESLRGGTEYTDYSLAVADYSEGDGVAAVASRHGARHIAWRRRPRNLSAMKNAAAAETSAPMLLFLDDDVSPADRGWLEAMVEHGARPEAGVVGARLLDPHGRILHAGMVIGIFGLCGNAFRGCPAAAPTYQGLGETVRNVSAVSGACMLVRAEVLRAAGGFDESALPGAFHDADLCLRVLEAGKRVIYTPHAALLHGRTPAAGWSRRDASPAEVHAFQSRWRKYIDHDPFYNPNLTHTAEDYGLRSREECR